METWVNKKVRIRSHMQDTTLVACIDRKTVNHVKIYDNDSNKENSWWIIKNENPNEAVVQIESAHGTLLGWSRLGHRVFQICRSQDDNPINYHHWVMEAVPREGFPTVRFKAGKEPFELYGYHKIPRVKLRHRNPDFQSMMEYYGGVWDLELVETSTINSRDHGIGKPQTMPLNKEIASPAEAPIYTYKANQMYVNYVYSDKPAPFIFPNYEVNSGHNKNETGNQTVGGVTIHTQIGNP